MKEKEKICSRCHRDLSKTPNEGGCTCATDHSASGYMKPVHKVGNPDYKYLHANLNTEVFGLTEQIQNSIKNI